MVSAHQVTVNDVNVKCSLPNLDSVSSIVRSGRSFVTVRVLVDVLERIQCQTTSGLKEFYTLFPDFDPRRLVRIPMLFAH
jgi:hypothetical protein